MAIGKQFTRRWMHNGMVEARGGEKMSKSLGNVLTLSDLFEQSDPRAYRLLVLQSHYRAPIEVTATTLSDAASALGRLGCFERPARRGGRASTASRTDPEVQRMRSCERMQDDLDTPGATAVLFDAIRRANVAFDSHEAPRAAELTRAVLECFGAVGLEARGARRDSRGGARARPPPRPGTRGA